MADTWTGTTWFIEGDISDCFGSLDHKIMVDTLSEKIHDGRFLRLVRHMLTAGYLEDWVWNATLSGAPQGGVASPILSNIYLHRLDTFVETVLIPQYTRGGLRKRNREYGRVHKAIRRARQRGDRTLVRSLRKQLRSLPSGDPQDPGYRRLHYARYADDHLLGFIGPKAEAEEIKQRLAAFLRDDLRLELSQEKTLITHARTGAAKFLGYEITVQHDDHKVTRNHRSLNGTVGLRVPRSVIKAKCVPFMRRGQPASRPPLSNLGDYDIVRIYGAQYRGVVQFYLADRRIRSLDDHRDGCLAGRLGGHLGRGTVAGAQTVRMTSEQFLTVGSMLARYQPTNWARSISIDTSADATALEHLMDTAHLACVNLIAGLFAIEHPGADQPGEIQQYHERVRAWTLRQQTDGA